MGQALTPRQVDAQQRVHELLTELVEIIGPSDDGQAEYERGEEPSGKPTLWEHVTVCHWVDEDRNDFYTVLPGAAMPMHHTVGLLHAGLTYGNYDAI